MLVAMSMVKSWLVSRVPSNPSSHDLFRNAMARPELINNYMVQSMGEHGERDNVGPEANFSTRTSCYQESASGR
jgi:hypothetical protein